MWLSASLAGFITGAGLIVAVGAQNAFVLRIGLQRRYVGMVVLICILSDIVMLGIGIGGAGTVFRSLPVFASVIRYVGAAFLIVYGLLSLKRAYEGGCSLNTGQVNPHSRMAIALACLAFTFLNPHFYLDTLVMMGSLSLNYSGSMAVNFYLGVCCASILWFLLLGYGARILLPLFRQPRAWRVLDSLIGCMMLGLSAVLLTES